MRKNFKIKFSLFDSDSHIMWIVFAILLFLGNIDNLFFKTASIIVALGHLQGIVLKITCPKIEFKDSKIVLSDGNIFKPNKAFLVNEIIKVLVKNRRVLGIKGFKTVPFITFELKDGELFGMYPEHRLTEANKIEDFLKSQLGLKFEIVPK